MQIQLCQKSVVRLADGNALLAALRERDHVPVVKDCLNRCQGCQMGLVIAVADGSPMSARDADAFLAELDELAADA